MDTCMRRTDMLHEHDIAARGLGILVTREHDLDLSGMSIKLLAGQC